nr:potassium channel family protein [uncultured Cupriavidus sp.]
MKEAYAKGIKMKNAAEDGSIGIRIQPHHVISEFGRVLWHLRGVLFLLLVVFALLSVAMYVAGGAIDVATRAPVPAGRVVYFCAITALTIGYGDVVPTTDLGCLIAVLLGILGVLMTGLVTAAAVYGVQAAAHREGIQPR